MENKVKFVDKLRAALLTELYRSGVLRNAMGTSCVVVNVYIGHVSNGDCSPNSGDITVEGFDV